MKYSCWFAVFATAGMMVPYSMSLHRGDKIGCSCMAVEVERAYFEGHNDRIWRDYQTNEEETFSESRAKRVTEGGE